MTVIAFDVVYGFFDFMFLPTTGLIQLPILI
jgi:hypothetical protein